MRRYWRERPPPGMFRGAELTRLVSGLVMLAVLYQLIVWALNADTWRWWVNQGNQPAPPARSAGPPGSKPTPRLPPATGPTDEDPDQAETAREEFQALTDGTLTLGPEEIEPYDRLIEWVKNQSFARLYGRAKKGLRYTNLHDDAERHRGDLVALDVELRLASDEGKNRFGVPLYEAWAVTDQSVGRLYDLIVVDFPTGIPLGQFIHEKARFAGYFLKLQGYHSGLAKPGQPPEKAPLLIGRLQWEPAAVVAAPVPVATQGWTRGLSLLAVIGAVLVLGWGALKWLRPRPVARSMISPVAGGEAVPIEAWLERSSFGAAGDEERPENQEDVLHGNGKPG